MEISHFLQYDRILLFDLGEEFGKEATKLILGGCLPEYQPRELAHKFLLVTPQNLKEKLLHIVVGLDAEEIEFV